MSERIEVRRNDDGTIDEVLLYVGERCVFHMEQMGRASWFFGLYPKGEEPEQFYINAETKPAKARVTVRSGPDSQPTTDQKE